jgi:isopentenyl diphosphate isomerase/L-lactate dehydrogenase-like FMN-dependent dehydrogenase
MPLVIKGIQTAEDARLCVQHGVDGLIVSNHGGHALEGSRGTMEMLPEVVDAAGGRVEVYLDGGVRRGADVLKALGLGAAAVFIGRPVYWGLAVDGEAGVRHVLEILRDELDVAMGLCGVASAREVDRSLVIPPGVAGADPVDRLERLAGLLERGYLTREEFDTQKAKVLGR